MQKQQETARISKNPGGRCGFPGYILMKSGARIQTRTTDLDGKTGFEAYYSICKSTAASAGGEPFGVPPAARSTASQSLPGYQFCR